METEACQTSEREELAIEGQERVEGRERATVVKTLGLALRRERYELERTIVT